MNLNGVSSFTAVWYLFSDRFDLMAVDALDREAVRECMVRLMYRFVGQRVSRGVLRLHYLAEERKVCFRAKTPGAEVEVELKPDEFCTEVNRE
ncbi:hypothetical protein G20c_07 [Thermus phage G20c]|nr:hypothetical protein G20c_07 [Thermus phage G20c]